MKDREREPPGFLFWALAPFLILLAVGLPFFISDWTPPRAVMLVGLECLCFLAFLGLLSPDRFWWAWRGVGALVFVGTTVYVIAVFVESGGKFTVGGSRGDISVFNAILAFIFFGLPGLFYALLGRPTLFPEEDISLDEDEDDFDDEESWEDAQHSEPETRHES